MRRPIATIAAWLGLPPGLALIVLIASGFLRPWVAVICLIGVFLWSFTASRVLARDLARVRARITQPEAEGNLALLTPGLDELAQLALHAIETERRSRRLSATDASNTQRLLDRLPDALFQLDGPHGARRIVWRNPAAASAYGTEESALLRHPTLRTALSEVELHDRPVRTSVALSAPIARDLDATLIRAGGETQSRTLYLLLTDRTREREIERMRADFVANASHELRTPLTSLIGFIETLQGPARDDAQAFPRFLAIMAEQAARMQRLIADLLSLSRIEMIEHQPPSDLVELTAVLHQVVGFMEPILREGGVKLTLDVPDELPLLRADSGQLAQVFGNLIDNAVKYGALKHGKGGRITIHAQSMPSADQKLPGVLVSVTDDGPGIAREHLPRLTERFYRADKGRARTVGGTGLGLAIAKHVVARHRGRLTIESVEGEGTACRVWLPTIPHER